MGQEQNQLDQEQEGYIESELKALVAEWTFSLLVSVAPELTSSVVYLASDGDLVEHNVIIPSDEFDHQ